MSEECCHRIHSVSYEATKRGRVKGLEIPLLYIFIPTISPIKELKNAILLQIWCYVLNKKCFVSSQTHLVKKLSCCFGNDMTDIEFMFIHWMLINLMKSPSFILFSLLLSPDDNVQCPVSTKGRYL